MGLYKNWNYSARGSPEYRKYNTAIEETASQQTLGGVAVGAVA